MSSLKDSIKKKVKSPSAIDVLTAPIESKPVIQSNSGLQELQSNPLLHDKQNNTSIQSIQDNTSIHSNNDLQDNNSLHSKHGLHGIQGNLGKQDLLDNSSLQSKPELQSKKSKQSNTVKKSTHKGLDDGWTRATFIMSETYLDKIKDYAYWERLQIKEVLNEALDNFFEDKKVRKRPSRKGE